MMRLAWRDIRKHWGRSLVAVLLIAMPTVIVASFFSLFYSAFQLEEYPENAYTYARTNEQPREDFTPVYRHNVDVSANGITLSEWVTALSFGEAADPGTIVLNRDSARALGVSPGDSVSIAEETLTVADTRMPKNAVANYADFARLENPNERWWASPNDFEAPPGIFVLDGHTPPKYLLTYVYAFMTNWTGAAMLISLFGLVMIVTVALTAPLFTIARTRNLRTQQILEQVGTLKSPLPWQGLILGLAGAVVGVLGSGLLTEIAGYWLFGVRPHWGWDLALLIAALSLISTLISASVRPKFTIPLWLGPVILTCGIVLLFEQNVGLFLGVPLAALGAAICGPALLWLMSRFGRHLHPIPRMALRDALRNRPRTSAAMASIIATITVVGLLSVALPGMALGSKPISDGLLAKAIVKVDSPHNYRPLVDELAKTYGEPVDLYGDEQASSDLYPTAWSDMGIYSYRLAADPRILDMLEIPADKREAARTRLENGEAVLAKDLGIDRAGELVAGTGKYYQGSLFPKAPNPIQQFQLIHTGTTNGMDIGAANASRSLRLVTGFMLGLGMVFIMGVIALIVALTAAQSRRDRDILGEVGGVGRDYVAWQAAIVALPAMLLGTAVGGALLILYRASWLGGWN